MRNGRQLYWKITRGPAADWFRRVRPRHGQSRSVVSSLGRAPWPRRGSRPDRLVDLAVAPLRCGGRNGTIMPDWTITHDFAYVPGGAEWVTAVLADRVLP